MNTRALPAVCLLLVLSAFAVPAQVPELITYQGRLIDGTNLVNGEVNLVLALYTNLTGGVPVYVDSNKVAVVDGLYSTHLGDGTLLGNLPVSLLLSNLHIEVEVNGTRLSPRERVAAVAYALMADGVRPDGITSAMIADGAVGTAQLASNAVTATRIAIGAVGSAQLALGAVRSNHLAAGAVGIPQLANPYQAGTIVCSDYPATNLYEFEDIVTNLTVAFSPAFDSTPVVTVALDSPSDEVLESSRLHVVARSDASFTARASFPNIPIAAAVLDRDHYNCENVAAAVVNGHPAIAYQADGTNRLFYVRANDPYGYTWGTPVGITSTYSSIESYTCLEVIHGRPAICWSAATGPGSGFKLKFVRALDADGTAWAPVVTVDNGDQYWTSYSCSLDVVEDHPAIAYFRAGDGSNGLMYARADDTNGSTWVLRQVLTNNADAYAGHCSLEVVHGNPAIAFRGKGTDDVSFVRAADSFGASWGSPVVVDTNADAQWVTMLISPDNGRPCVGYCDTIADDIRFVMASDVTGTVWGTVRRAATNGVLGSYTSMTFTDEQPSLAYLNATEDSLEYVRASNTAGTSWEDPVTVVSIASGAPGDMTLLLVEGAPALVYGLFDDLFYVRSGNPPANTYVNWIAVEP